MSGDSTTTHWGEGGRDGVELYDHETDSAEMVNLADSPEHEDMILKLSAQLHQRIAQARTAPQGIKQISFDDRRRVPQ